MNLKCLILLFATALMGLSACKNNDNVFPKVVLAHVNVVNASADTINFFFNGTRQNNRSSLYPGGQSFYITEPDGLQNYQFKKAGSSTVLFGVPLNLKDTSYNSLYIYGPSASQTFTTSDVLLHYTAHPDTTQLRFVNISPDAGSLSLTVNDTLSFMSQPFKSSTAFAFIKGGQKKIKIFQAGAATPNVDTVITFQPGYIYTLFSKGLINGKGNAAFDVGIVVNAD